MTPTFHRAQTRQIVNAAGGAQPTAEILGLADTSAVSRWLNGNGTMSAWHLTSLQCALGVSSYSDAISNLVSPPTGPAQGLLTCAAEACRSAGSLPAQVMDAMADGRIDEIERRALMQSIAELRGAADAAERALLGVDTAPALAAE